MSGPKRYTLYEKPRRLRVVRVSQDSFQWLIDNSNGRIFKDGNTLGVTTPDGVVNAGAGDWVGLYDNGELGVFDIASLAASWEPRVEEPEEL
jgi:hypothetical protein